MEIKDKIIIAWIIAILFMVFNTNDRISKIEEVLLYDYEIIK